MSQSAYIRKCLFGKKASKRVVPEADRILLAQILAKLGESRIANNLNQIAYHANCGSLLLDDATIEEINEACLHAAKYADQQVEQQARFEDLGISQTENIEKVQKPSKLHQQIDRTLAADQERSRIYAENKARLKEETRQQFNEKAHDVGVERDKEICEHQREFKPIVQNADKDKSRGWER